MCYQKSVLNHICVSNTKKKKKMISLVSSVSSIDHRSMRDI